jgi:hypothetical protein
VHSIHVWPNHDAGLVDELGLGINDGGRRSERFECVYTPAQERRTYQVVVRGPLKKLAIGHLDEPIVVPSRTQIFGQPRVSNAPVTPNVGFADILRGICGRIVRYDELEIPKVLSEDRI